MTIFQYNCPKYFTILTSTLINQIASFSSSDWHWSFKSFKCQWNACTWNFHFFLMYSHLLGQIICAVDIGWLSIMKTQMYCFLGWLGSGISIISSIWQPDWTKKKNCMGTYVALWSTNSFEILSQYWEAIRKHTDNQLPPDWTATGAVGFINLYFVQILINFMVKQRMAAALMAAGSRGKWQVVSAACCSV